MNEEEKIETTTEEPVMIAENIDEMSQEELASITTSVPVVSEETVEIPQTTPEMDIPNNMPDLGNREENSTEGNVPTFQQIPGVEEEKKEEEKVKQPEEEEKTSFAEIPTTLTDMYQAKPSSEQNASLEPKPNQGEETAQQEESEEEEEYEDSPKKKSKLVPLIIFGIVLIAVVVVGVIGLRTRGEKGPIKLLRPERLANSNTNIAVLGDASTPNAQVAATILKKLGTETAVEEIEKCPSQETYGVEYGLFTSEIKTQNNNLYNINYSCGKESTMKYLLVSEGEQTVDGAIIVLSSNTGVSSEIKDYLHTLNRIGIKKVVIYIIDEGNSTQVEEEIKGVLENQGFDNANTPIVKGSTTDEEKIETLISKAEKWIKKETSYKEPSVVPSYKTMKLFTTFLVDKNIDNLSFTINKVDYKAKVTLEEGQDGIKAGETQEITIELEEEIPAVTGMRVIVKEGDTLVGIGVISELS
ncbi:MAG: hypothetical protein IKF71_02635 [Bacilli bacterium]|nr:hypothetical protein [Bacilli bacterium]